LTQLTYGTFLYEPAFLRSERCGQTLLTKPFTTSLTTYMNTIYTPQLRRCHPKKGFSCKNWHKYPWEWLEVIKLNLFLQIFI